MSIRDQVGRVSGVSRDESILTTVYYLPDRITEAVFEKWAVNVTYLAFAFVFFYFGLQKPLPAISPVRTPISIFASELSGLLSTLFFTEIVISTTFAIYFIGAYEMFLGLLFLFKQLRAAFWLFLVHQAVAFFALVLIWDSVFQPPWLTVAGIELPYILGGFSAFVLKNVIFVGAFMLLASKELGGNSAGAVSNKSATDAESDTA
jgi:hypothetical protein